MQTGRGRCRSAVERYIDVEDLVPGADIQWSPPTAFPYPVARIEDAELAASRLRAAWNLGSQPISDLPATPNIALSRNISPIGRSLRALPIAVAKSRTSGMPVSHCRFRDPRNYPVATHKAQFAFGQHPPAIGSDPVAGAHLVAPTTRSPELHLQQKKESTPPHFDVVSRGARTPERTRDTDPYSAVRNTRRRSAPTP
jgi:hypothetical protein